MLILLSPAKTFHDISDEKLNNRDSFKFQYKTEQLIKTLCTYDEGTLSEWMKMSLELAKVNYTRYQELRNQQAKGYPAIDFFNGEVFKALDVATLSECNREYLNRHLMILSGLYGCIHPSECIAPYRLEMRSKFREQAIQDLYKYWKDDLTTYILNCLKAEQEKVIINLASKEYIKAVDINKIKACYPVVDIEFKEQTNEGKYKVVGMYAKTARGKMLRYMAENHVNTVQQLKTYTTDGYALNEDLSHKDTLVFTREQSKK